MENEEKVSDTDQISSKSNCPSDSLAIGKPTEGLVSKQSSSQPISSHSLTKENSAKNCERKEPNSGRNRQQKWTEKCKTSSRDHKSTVTLQEKTEYRSQNRSGRTIERNDIQPDVSGLDRRLSREPREKERQPVTSYTNSRGKKDMQLSDSKSTAKSECRRPVSAKASYEKQRRPRKDTCQANDDSPSSVQSKQTRRSGHKKRRQEMNHIIRTNERKVPLTPSSVSNAKTTVIPHEKKGQAIHDVITGNDETTLEPQTSRHSGKLSTALSRNEKHEQSEKDAIKPNNVHNANRSFTIERTGSDKPTKKGVSTAVMHGNRHAQLPTLKQRPDKRETNALIISDAMYFIDKTSKHLFTNHAKKTHSVAQKLKQAERTMKDLYTYEEGKSEVKILRQKQDELNKQKEEFTEERDRLKKQIRSLESRVDLIDQLLGSFRKECYRFDMSLPVYARRREIVQLVKDNQVSVILGETGSGKSTQLVQYLHENGGLDGTIVCTQPRRVAALTLASHVAKEMLTRLGDTVGYKVGSQQKQCRDTKILFTTDHSFLNECLEDPDLRTYSCVVVDEAHERSLYTDLLLSIIKRCLPRRPDLRVIITSATIDPAVFQQFFGGCPVLRVTGRNFPVEVIWFAEELEQDDYCENAVGQVIQIHTLEKKPGDILVFVTSPAETEKCYQLLETRLKMRADFICMQLHGKQQSEEQQKVFKPAPKGKRKIVFATNCAETSITIEGICYVVDTGRAKEMCYDPKRNLNSLCLSIISKSSADQRKGRAGRTAPGKCYRLYSKKTYHEMEPVTLPEILRIHLGHALLKLAELGVDRETYEFVQSPSEDTITKAMEMLHVLGALIDGKLTDKGRWIARLPFDPRLGLLTYMGKEQNVLYDSIVLAAVMSAEGGIFYRGTCEKEQRIHDLTKLKFSLDKGDSLSCLAVYKKWLRVPDTDKNQWCIENGLNAKTLRGIKETVGEICRVLHMDCRNRTFSQEDETERLRKMIVQCYATNLCHYLGRDGAGYYAANAYRKVHIHPSSCLHALASVPEWVVFDQLIQTSRDFITGVTPVEESWVDEMDEKVLGFNLAEIRQKTIQKTFSRQVGSRAFFEVVGPCYTKLRELEANFPAPPGSVVFVEAVKEVGEINVYSTAEESQAAALAQELETIINAALLDLESEDREELVAGNAKQGIRAVIGQGGAVEEILMPSQSRKLFIKLIPVLAGREASMMRNENPVTEEMVKKHFSRYGTIKFCKKFEEGWAWGFVIFSRSAYAMDALQDDAHLKSLGYTVQLERRRRTREDKMTFRMQLRWARQPCLEYALVILSPESFKRCVCHDEFPVGDHTVTITVTNKEEHSLHIDGVTTDMTEDIIRQALLHTLGEREDAQNIVLDVLILRKRFLSAEERNLMFIEEQINEFFANRLPGHRFHVHLHQPEDSDSFFRVTVRFQDPMEGYNVYKRIKSLDKYPWTDEEIVELTPNVEIKTEIQAKIMDSSREDLNEAVGFLAEQNVTVEIYQEDDWEGGPRTMVITARSVAEAVEAKDRLDTALKGVVMNCTDAQTLFTTHGSQLVARLQTETGAHVTEDRWSRTFTIRGPQRARIEMYERLAELTVQVHAHSTAQYELRGDTRPPGLMKAVLLKFGEDLHGLLSATGLRTATLNFRLHRLTVSGTQDSLEKAADQLAEITEDVSSGAGMERRHVQSTEKCSVCTCYIELGQLYRLELCAHPYCKDCYKHMVHYAVKDKAIPILCCHENCERRLALRDLTGLVRDAYLNMNMNMETLVKAAVMSFVTNNVTTFRHCPTPDCPGLYRITEPNRRYDSRMMYSQRGLRPPTTHHFSSFHRHDQDTDAINVYVCPACTTSLCTTCHKIGAHSGHFCPVASSGGSSREGAISHEEIQDWMAKDPQNRKQCPKCRHGIEKESGCNNMVCRACKTVFCWVCCKRFFSGVECDDHLVRQHGGVFPANFNQRRNQAERQPRRF